MWDRFLQVLWLLFGLDLSGSLGKGETVGCYWPTVTTPVGWDRHLYKESGRGIPPPSSLNSYIKFLPFWPSFSLILVFHNVWKNLHEEEKWDQLQPLLLQLLSSFFLPLIVATLHRLFRISLKKSRFPLGDQYFCLARRLHWLIWWVDPDLREGSATGHHTLIKLRLPHLPIYS